MPPQKKSTRNTSLVKRFKRWAIPRLKRVSVAATLLFVLFMGIIFLTLPSINSLYEAGKSPSVVIKTENGVIINSYGETYGEFLTYRELPKPLIQAVLATEDRNFFHHFGLDPMGLGRAVIANLRAGEVVQGGSTITQQVAKNLFLSPERTLTRKFRELLLAFRLEMRFSKEEIFAIYLNRVYFGAGCYGVDAAAHRYFGKSARELTLNESAIIAGLLKAPSRYTPTGNPEASFKRAESVLAKMVDAGFITPEKARTAKKAMAQTISTAAGQEAESARYFTDWVMDELQDMFGEIREDLVVTTTFRPDLQRAGEQAIASVMDNQGEALHASQAALVAMTPDGAVRAMIGGRVYNKSQYNRAVQAHRQPGSAFKMFVYLAGLEAGLTPYSRVVDQPVTIGKWTPKNYTGDYKGEMYLRDAVAQSINTVSVQVAEYAGLNRVVDMAHRLGVTSDLVAQPSIALGSNEVTLLELTTAYGHLAANGAMVHPYAILQVETASGEELYERPASAGGQALSESIVGMMNVLLSGVIEEGTGRGAAIGRPAAGKTGTTSDYRDAWFLGYTPDLVAGVWVGNDDNTPMKKVTGGTLPAPIWRNFMQTALARTAPHRLPKASNFEAAPLPWQREQGGGGIFRLSPQFWDKLFDNNEVEYTYPSGNNNR